MGKRFNNLEDVVNTFTEAQLLALPTTNKFRKYYEWKRDPEKRKLPAGTVPIRGRNVKVALSPFGLPFEADDRVTVSVSKRVSDAFAEVGGATLYNLLTTVPITSTKLAGFIPARAIVAQRLANSISVPGTRNRITGRDYRTNAGRSYTVPFGRKSATTSEFEIQAEILQAREATNIITFTPERRRAI
jgi:hypothetical protein